MNLDILGFQPVKNPPKMTLGPKKDPIRGRLNGTANSIPTTPTNLSTTTEATPATLLFVFCKTPAILTTSPPTMVGKKFETNKPENTSLNISKKDN
jgi:hypothetical protein